jgi:uncharacterized protein YheU (UPF0270 family)
MHLLQNCPIIEFPAGGAVTEWYEDPRDRPPPIEVPHTELSPEALRGVIEAFVLREGTDYGERDIPHDTKLAQVQRQLERGEAKILFDPVTESVDLVVTNKVRPPSSS